MKPIVLHIAPITDTLVAGLAVSVPALVTALARLQVPTGLLTTAREGPYNKSESFPIMYLYNLPRFKTIAALPQPLDRPNLVVFHSTYIPAQALLAYEAHRKGIPYIITPRGGMTRGAQRVKRLKKLAGNLLFFNWMVKHAAALHCLTENEAIDAQSWNCPVFIVANGVELQPREFLAHPGEKIGLRFTFLGRFDIHHKGLDLLLNACAIAQEDLRNAKAQVHLYGPDVGASATILNQLVHTHKIQDMVYFHEPVWGQAKQTVLRESDLFLHVSRFEGHPMAVLEALSYGLPCLLTPGTNLADEVASARAGWKVEPHPQAIAQGLRDILAARSELAMRGQQGQSLVENKYGWDQIATQLLDEYIKLIR